MNFQIRIGALQDIPEMQSLFVNTIKYICNSDYSQEQIDVWISGVDDVQRWETIIKTQKVLIAHSEEKLLGYITLKDNHYIDLLYVHKDYQKNGIAFRLYSEVEKYANNLQIIELHSDVSITAKPFFEKLGFVVIAEEQVERKGILLTNYKMKKIL